MDYKGAFRKVKRASKEFGSTAKLVGYQVPKEIVKRAVSHRYTHERVFGEKLPKKRK